MFDELKEVKDFKEITNFNSFIMQHTLKKLNLWRIFKK